MSSMVDRSCLRLDGIRTRPCQSAILPGLVSVILAAPRDLLLVPNRPCCAEVPALVYSAVVATSEKLVGPVDHVRAHDLDCLPKPAF